MKVTFQEKGCDIMEKWKEIKGYESIYSISDMGRVKNVKRNKILKLPINRGYFRIGLHKEGKCKHFLIHRLVAEHFIPNPLNKEQVNHINGNKTDNTVKNLEWCTNSENIQHAYDTNLNKGRCRRAVRCKETGKIFESTTKAGHYLNKTKFMGSKVHYQIADKIRLVAKGKQKSAYGYTWEYVD